MNIYEKLQKVRVELQNANLKKSGHNKFAGFHYFELSDFLPAVNVLMEKYKLCSTFNIGVEEAILTIINAEAPEEREKFVCPMGELNLKGAHQIQNLGGQITYLRRYLYMNAMEIIEADHLDSTLNKPATKKAAKKEEAVIDRGTKEGLIKFAAAKNIKENVLRILCEREYKKPLDEFNAEECRSFCNLIEERGNK